MLRTVLAPPWKTCRRSAAVFSPAPPGSCGTMVVRCNALSSVLSRTVELPVPRRAETFSKVRFVVGVIIWTL